MKRFGLLLVFLTAGMCAIYVYARASHTDPLRGVTNDLDWVIITGPAGRSAPDFDEVVRIASSTSDYVKIYASVDAFLAATHPQVVQVKSIIEIGPTAATLRKLPYPPMQMIFFHPAEMPPEIVGKKLPWKMFVALDDSLRTERPLVWKAWADWCETNHATLVVGSRADAIAWLRGLYKRWR